MKKLLGSDAELVEFHENAYQAIKGADALCLITDWKEFKNPDLNRIKDLMNYPVILDGRNLYDPQEMKKAEIIYYSIGRN
jgi:UDPglucose 6-dehydrogenase